MKIYKLDAHGGIKELKISDSQTSLGLGEYGRGREKVIVPIIRSGAGCEACIKKTDNGPVVVLGNFPPEKRCIAVINSWGGYSKGRAYFIPDQPGITKVQTGYVASGKAGRAAHGEDGLCIIDPGTSFRIRSKYDATYYTWDGENWTAETPAEYKARLALQEVKNGGGEWL